MASDVCGAEITGHRYSTGIVLWRDRCKARPMKYRTELAGYGFMEGRCFQHQPSEVRNAVHRYKGMK